MTEPDLTEDDIEIIFNDLDDNVERKTYEGIEEDECGHAWGLGWIDSDKPHPGFGGSTNICGGYVGQCDKCGMYNYEFWSGTATPGKYEGQMCGVKIR
jgi:hypothetical protein